MIAFRSKSGFTLIEVLLALAIIGMVLTPIFLLQTQVLTVATGASRDLQRIFSAKKFLVETEITLADDVQQTSAERKIQDPPVVLKYEYKKVSGDSGLKKFKNLYQETVIAQWSEKNRKRQERLVTFLYKPEIKK